MKNNYNKYDNDIKDLDQYKIINEDFLISNLEIDSFIINNNSYYTDINLINKYIELNNFSDKSKLINAFLYVFKYLNPRGVIYDAKNKKVKMLDTDIESLKKYLTSYIKLEVLNLSNNNIREKGSKILAKSLIEIKTLIELNLNYNKIGSIGTKYITNLIKSSYNLKVIKLSNNNIEEEGVYYICKYLFKYNKNSKYISKVNKLILQNTGLSKRKIKIENIANKKNENTIINLSELHLDFNSLCDLSIKYLAGSFINISITSNNFNLIYLNLSYNNISEKGIKCLYKSFFEIDKYFKYNNSNKSINHLNCIKLKEFYLDSNDLRSNTTINYIAKLLFLLKNLEVLSLNNCNLNTNNLNGILLSLYFIIKSNHLNFNIKKLSLNANKIKDSFLVKLISVLNLLNNKQIYSTIKDCKTSIMLFEKYKYNNLEIDLSDNLISGYCLKKLLKYRDCYNKCYIQNNISNFNIILSYNKVGIEKITHIFKTILKKNSPININVLKYLVDNGILVQYSKNFKHLLSIISFNSSGLSKYLKFDFEYYNMLLKSIN